MSNGVILALDQGTTSARAILFDLDDTLAPSKSAMPPAMATALRRLLDVVPVCIISGGQVGQFRDQVLAHLDADADELSRLHLMPTCGTQYFTFDGSGFTPVYVETLTEAERDAALKSLETRARELELWETETWGPILEDRGSQVTFSALGQSAPVDAKKAWDPTGEKKSALREAVQVDLPGLEVRSGGSTSVDITRRGIDKAYGVRWLAEHLQLPAADSPVEHLPVDALHLVNAWRFTGNDALVPGLSRQEPCDGLVHRAARCGACVRDPVAILVAAPCEPLLLLIEPFFILDGGQQFIEQVACRLTLGAVLQLVDESAECAQGIHHACIQMALCTGFKQSLKQGNAPCTRIGAQGLQGFLANAAFGRGHGPYKGGVIVLVHQQPQVGNHILDFRAFKKALPAT